jgi:nucleotide-binding universal stress UspA family protein
MSTVSIKQTLRNSHRATRDTGEAINHVDYSDLAGRNVRATPIRTWSTENEPAFREVLVPVDGSPYAEHALPWAIHMATLAGVPLRLVHVHLPMQPSFHGRRAKLHAKYDRSLREPIEEYLADLNRRITRSSSTRAKFSIVDGHDAASLLAGVGGASTNPVVMATRGRSTIGRLLLGGASNAIFRGASRPVLHVRGYKCPVDLTARPHLQRALTAIDGDALSASVLEPVSRLVKLFNGQLTLLRVVESPSLLGFGGGQAGNMFTEVRKLNERHCAELGSIARSWSMRLPSVRTSLVWTDASPAREILSQAYELRSDYIAITTRDRNGIRRLLRPGVDEYLIHHSTIPVLVAKKPKSEPE